MIELIIQEIASVSKKIIPLTDNTTLKHKLEDIVKTIENND